MRLWNRFFRRQAEAATGRKCRFESMEPRRMLAADPLLIGAVYIEEDLGSDQQGDAFELTFEGGADGTELTRVIIDGDQNIRGFGIGDAFFDTQLSGLGADRSYAFSTNQLDAADPNANVTAHVTDGGTRLVLEFEHFHAGDKLSFHIDVDEVEEYDPTETDLTIVNEGFDPITSGIEFQGSSFEAYFQAPHYQDVHGSGEFRNRYDDQLENTTLDLPMDDHMGKRDRTAGVVVGLQQIPKPISISGSVFEDVDLDLARDPGDAPLSNVQLSLWVQNDEQYVDTGLTTSTDAQGNYEFGTDLDLMPGMYQVRESQPDGYYSVGSIPGTINGAPVGASQGDNVVTFIDVPLGDLHVVDVDFAEALPAELSGYVYHDRDDDGIRDAGEEGLANVAIEVIPVDTITPIDPVTIQTDNNGFYHATNLPPGVYRVVETSQPAGYFDGLDTIGTVDGRAVGQATNPGDELTEVNLVSGSVGLEYNFGEIGPGEIHGNVHLSDADGNCFEDSRMARPLEGVVVQLLNSAGEVVATTSTDASGDYSFQALRPGVYSIVEMTPDGLIDGSEHVGANGHVVGDDHISVNLAAGQRITNVDFCEHEPASLSGSVFHDENNNGVKELGEEPIAGVDVQLRNESGAVVAIAQTDSAGNYSFENLAAGKYSIAEAQPIGWLDGMDSTGTINGVQAGAQLSNDAFSEIMLRWGESGVDFDFGELLAAGISGMVHADHNGNCVVDGDDFGLEGVTVELRDLNGNLVATTTTDVDGRYHFSDLTPGTYTIREIQPDGYFQGGEQVGSGGGAVTAPDTISRIVLGSGALLEDYNFCEVPPATLKGTVFVDKDQDKVFDSNEMTIAGVQLELVNSQGDVVAVTTTDGAGQYCFEGLPPDTYTVREHQPHGYYDGGQTAGSGGGDADGYNEISDVVLSPGDDHVGYDFAEWTPATLSGFVFQDGDPLESEDGLLPDNVDELRDGLRTADDSPIEGATLWLFNSETGEPVRGEELLPGFYPPSHVTATTNADGHYQFTGLRPGVYTVYELQPQGYEDWLDHAGSQGGDAVNAFGELIVGQPNDQDVIANIAIGVGESSVENNFSELLVLPPPGNVFPLDPDQLITEVGFIYPANYDPPVNLLTLAPPLPPPIPVYGASPNAFSWHLSIIDGGFARPSQALQANQTTLPVAVWDVPMNQGQFRMLAADGNTVQTVAFGQEGAIPVAGDFNGDGQFEIGIYKEGRWYIDINGNGRWDDDDLYLELGEMTDQPVTGDWDGDGKDDVGIYGPQWSGDQRAIAYDPGLPDPDNVEVRGLAKNMPPAREHATDGHRTMQLSSTGENRMDVIDHVFRFGNGRLTPITGDWNGDGIRSIGYFDNGVWRLDSNGDGQLSAHDATVEYGSAGDLPVVGDFDGNGVDELGVYRNGNWYFDKDKNGELDERDLAFKLGGAKSQPVVGDWDGDGKDEPAVYDQAPDSQGVQARRTDRETR